MPGEWDEGGSLDEVVGVVQVSSLCLSGKGFFMFLKCYIAAAKK